jgi:hypothetical protein
VHRLRNDDSARIGPVVQRSESERVAPDLEPVSVPGPRRAEVCRLAEPARGATFDTEFPVEKAYAEIGKLTSRTVIQESVSREPNDGRGKLYPRHDAGESSHIFGASPVLA